MIGYKPHLVRLSADLMNELVRRIVAAADPDKIVLFGSRGRGDHRPDSDIDLLLVQRSDQPRYRRPAPIHAALADLPIEVDLEIAVYTPEEVEEYRGAPAAFVTTALREGTVLYEK
jgi:uncharacterized protein